MRQQYPENNYTNLSVLLFNIYHCTSRTYWAHFTPGCVNANQKGQMQDIIKIIHNTHILLRERPPQVHVTAQVRSAIFGVERLVQGGRHGRDEFHALDYNILDTD